jgi:hypothetical protein
MARRVRLSRLALRVQLSRGSSFEVTRDVRPPGPIPPLSSRPNLFSCAPASWDIRERWRRRRSLPGGAPNGEGFTFGTDRSRVASGRGTAVVFPRSDLPRR